MAAGNVTLANAGGGTNSNGTDVVTGTAAFTATTGTLDKYVEVGEEGALKYKEGAMLYTAAADSATEFGDQLKATQIAEADLGTYFELGGNPIRKGAADTSDVYADEDVADFFTEDGVYKGGLYLKYAGGNMVEIGAEQIENYFDIKSVDDADGSALEFSLHVGAEGGAMTDEKAISNKITVKIEAMSAAGIGINGLRSQTGMTARAQAASGLRRMLQPASRPSRLPSRRFPRSVPTWVQCRTVWSTPSTTLTISLRIRSLLSLLSAIPTWRPRWLSMPTTISLHRPARRCWHRQTRRTRAFCPCLVNQ